MKAILASSIGGQIKADGRRLPARLLDDNGLLNTILSLWKDDSKVI